MPVQEIKETKWNEFCQRFLEAHRGTLVTIETVMHDGTGAVLAQREPLREFSFQQTAACSDLIYLEAGTPPGTMIQHHIVEPIHVRLREDSGSQKILTIDAESGSVELKFSSGRIGAILKDLEMNSPEEMGRQGGRH